MWETDCGHYDKTFRQKNVHTEPGEALVWDNPPALKCGVAASLNLGCVDSVTSEDVPRGYAIFWKPRRSYFIYYCPRTFTLALL